MSDQEMELPYSIIKHHLDLDLLRRQLAGFAGAHISNGNMQQLGDPAPPEEIRKQWEAGNGASIHPERSTEMKGPPAYVLMDFTNRSHPDRDALRRMTSHFLPWS